jgi:hypothetical protein
MKIAIITLPLHTNYGGILQAYALKQILEGLGHETVVVDRKDKMPLPVWYKAPFIYMARAFKKIAKPSSSVQVFRELNYRRELPVRSRHTQEFVDEQIAPRLVGSYKDIHEGEYDAFVVGSDQVWRPRYFGKIEDGFLKFTKGWDVKRLAYAASFGTEKLEYKYEELESCSRLLSEFDAVSVREDVGVKMCDEWFGYEGASHVLDPVLLLDAQVYRNLAKKSENHSCTGKVMTYILDPSKEKDCITDFIARITSKTVQPLSVDVREVPPVEDWLAGFCDADFVVTDSFHGCVLSILLHKPFIAVGNSLRGMSRMNSLLSMFGLDARLVQGIDPEDDGEFWLTEPDWEQVESVLQTQRDSSVAFLESVLKKEVTNG